MNKLLLCVIKRPKRQIKKLSQDPIRSNAQIFVNIRNWVYRNMKDCPQAQRHFDKLGVSKSGLLNVTIDQ